MSYAYGAYGPYVPYGAYGTMSPYDVNALGLIQAYRAMGTKEVNADAKENDGSKGVSTNISSIKENMHKTCQGCPPDHKAKFESVERRLADISTQLGGLPNSYSNINSIKQNVDALYKTCQGCPPDYKAKFESVERRLVDISTQLGGLANTGSNIPPDLVAEIRSITDHLNDIASTQNRLGTDVALIHAEQSIDQKSFAARIELTNAQLSERIDRVDKSLFKVENSLLENTKVLQIIREKLEAGISIHDDLQTLDAIPRPQPQPDVVPNDDIETRTNTNELHIIRDTLHNIDKMSRINVIPIPSMFEIRSDYPHFIVSWITQYTVVTDTDDALNIITTIEAMMDNADIKKDDRIYKINVGDDDSIKFWICQVVALLLCNNFDLSLEGDLPSEVDVISYQDTFSMVKDVVVDVLKSIPHYSQMSREQILHVKTAYLYKISISEPFDAATHLEYVHRDIRKTMGDPIGGGRRGWFW